MDISAIPGLPELWETTRGCEDICIAVLDGEVDLAHDALAGAAVSRLEGPWPNTGLNSDQARHGTHVASVLFGQPLGPVNGVAPGCRGLVVPVFAEGRSPSQLDLARGIEAAIEAGAHVINISGGQMTASGDADHFLNRAVELCAKHNVLLVAAAGNDGCWCAHVPAALPSVLAVGAYDDSGRPLDSSNFGAAYAGHAILAPGVDITGAVPGGGMTRSTGTSMATPIVAGVVGLLLSVQRTRGLRLDPCAIKEVILAAADPCPAADQQTCQRYLSGTLNVRRATAMMEEPTTMAGANLSANPDLEGNAPGHEGATRCECETREVDSVAMASQDPASFPTLTTTSDRTYTDQLPLVRPSLAVTQSQQPTPTSFTPLVYALGTLGYDFGTEARRDSFKQLMPPVTVEGVTIPASPYDSRQMIDHLTANASESRSLIWTLNLELTPVYALEPVGGFAAETYALLTKLLAAGSTGTGAQDYVERVSVPGRLTDRSVRLFSGQIVPVVEIEQVRGLYGWRVNALIDAALRAATGTALEGEAVASTDQIRRNLGEFLTRVYYDLRNLGATSRDRALNFAATNAFQATQVFAEAVGAGMALDAIDVQRSPYARMDSDCWDVKLRFFDPENSRRARKVFRFTVDVSDLMPVAVGETRSWSEAG